MRNFNFTLRIIGIVLALMAGTSYLGATDIYVHTGANGTGANATPFDIGGLRSYLTSYTVASGTELNVYFASGPYNVTSVLTFNSTAANVNGLSVNFAPNPSNTGDVTFSNGSTNNIRFVATTGNAANPMSLNISNVIISDFSTTTTANVNGTTSLFTLSAGATIELENVTLNNITSTGYTLVTNSGSAEATFNVSGSTLTNITSTSAYLFRTSAANENVIFDGCTLSNWTSAGGAMFYLSSNADCSLTFSNNTEVSNFTVNAGHIFHLNDVATNSLTITGNTFTANRAGPSTAGNNDFNFVYVSNAATGNGSLDITNNTFTDNHTNGVFIRTVRSSPITGNTFSLNTTEHNTAATNRPFIQATAAVEIENNIFTTNTAHGNFIAASGATSLVGNMFASNQSAGGNSTGNNTFVALSGAADVSFNTFESNGPRSGVTTLGHLISLTGSGTKLYNNTFKTNAPTNAGYVILADAGSSASPILIYNNTLSGNTSGYAINIDNDYVKLFNNTIYASGRVSTGGQYGDLRIYNNIVGPGPNDIIAVTGANATTTGRTVRNIIGTSYYTAGVSSGTDIAVPLAAQLQTTLSGPPEWGREVYDLVQAQIYATPHAILKSGGSLSALATSLNVSTLPTLLATDQSGTTRNPAAISLGSVDRYGLFATQPGSIKVTYDVDDPIPHAMNYDLRDLILKYPEGVDPNNVQFDFVGGTPTLTNGTVSLSGYILHFAPFVDSDGYSGGNPISSIQIRVHEDIVSNQQSITPVNIYVLEVPRPPGLLNVFDYPNTCFDLMGTVDFTSAFRFVTSLYNDPPNFVGIPPGRKNPRENRIYGFSIPLIGDLDKDGYPEIFAIGRDDNGTGLQSNLYRYLYIYSGQAGEQLAKLRLDLGTGTGTPAAAGHTSGWHSTPSIMALVDADRDSIPEVVMAFPGSTNGSFPYANKVVSYKLTKIVPTPSTGNQYTMSLNWQSAANYNLGGSSGNSAQTSYQRPIPQIVDIEGNGDAKVVVYNKIYDAKTGTLEVTLGKLGVDAYVGTATNGAVTQDGYVNFSYIYDLDLDGKYDIVAGGKVYYNIDIANGTYQTVDFSSQVKDGRTGVADINGDGIPDVVVVNRVNSGSRLEIFVWNPDFLRLDAGGNIVKNMGVKTPGMLATLTMPFSNNSTGTNSYVYIGDIDGKEQVVSVAGVSKTYRLPEIAILSGQMTYNNGTGTYPVHIHPNVSGGGIPTSGTSPASGVLAAVTWDAKPSIPTNQRLKLSFVLGHQDGSVNTGFTMFDFDNDGMMEICYRDMQYLRIIKASRPYIAYNAALDDPAVLFRTRARSYTGFEYPVIADIDNDASAEMVVIATDQDANYAYGYVYAVGNGGGDKFAPARPVWNQFMYDPFKINDILQTPVGPAVNRLGKEFQYDLKIRNSAGAVTGIKENFNPFNATLNQITYHKADTVGATDRPYFEPIVFLTEAYIVGHDDPSSARRPRIVTEASIHYLEFTLGNRATAMTALSLNTPIAVYRNNTISQATHAGTTSLGLLTYQNNLPITQVVRPGQEIRVRMRIVAPDTELGVYWVRAGDDSKLNSSNVWEWHFGYNSTNEVASGTGYGLSSKAFRDCNWSDQSVRISQYRPFDDAVTVQQYNQAEIFMFLNDILPDLPGNNYYSGVVLGTNFSFTQPEAGTVSFNSSGQTSKFTYRNNGNTLENNVDSFTYTARFQDPATLAYIDRSAKVYIYVMESASGNFASCFGATTVIDLVNKPTGVSFDWYRENVGGLRFGVGRNYTMASQQMADSIYYLKPNMPVGRYHDIDFPRGRLAISLITPELNAVATLRWTGLVDNNWANPNNWVEIITDGGKKYEKPAGFAPSSCVDIIIPTGAVNYPEVRINPSHARHITMQDRAMLKNPQNLVYESASAEFKLKPAERDRYIMWSAPLKSVYSGDYHIKHAVTNQPVWGDVFVNFFQQSNPDNGSFATGAVNMFTASFGHLGTPLGLGRPFNLKVVTTTSSKDKTFLFPQTASSYTDNQTVPVTYPTTRSMGNRFITDDLSLNPSMDVFGGEFNGSLVQVVNPYFAYLNVSDFLANNPALSAGTYLIWNGEIHNSFDAVLVHPAPNGLRYTSTAPANVNVGWIPPLQSFFVQKVTPSTILTKVQMSADWTSVRNTDITNPYVLRATQEPEKGVLHIKATQGNNTSYTLLSYNKDASPNFNSKEDVLSLFFNEIGLTLYSVTQLKEPLAINTSGNFVSQPTYLGLRARDAGEIKLTFTGLPTFEHEVSLRDKQLNKLVPLKEGDTYTFAVSKPSGAGAAFDIPDRISLEMKYTGSVGTESISAEALDVHVSSEYGRILVQSNKGLINNLQIYSIPGTLVYSSNTLSDQFSIPVSGAQTYIVKIQFTNNENRVEKVFVK